MPERLRKSSRPGRRQALWLVPLLLALVLIQGFRPRAQPHPHVIMSPGELAAGARPPAAAAAVLSAAVRPRATVPVVGVSLAANPSLRPLPRSYLGLSVETWTVPVLASDPAATARVLDLLRVPGDGPLMLRVGGQSSEQTYWDAPQLGTRAEAYRPGPDWLNMLAGLTRASQLRLLVDLNLVAHSPSMAASFAQAVAQAVPSGSLAGFEVGNEPDIAHRQTVNPLAPPGERVPRTPAGWDRYTPAQYISLFRSYAAAVHRAVGSARLAGPEVFFAGRDAFWLQQLVDARPAGLGMLTVHRYPLSACTSRTARDRATIDRLLGPNASLGLADELVGAVQIADRRRLPLRLSEFNSVTCGGTRGVSNSFAAALWAPDTLFSIWNVGAAGVNLHLVPSQPNAAFSVSPAGVVAQPLLYGMIMFARATASGAKLTGVSTSGASAHNVEVWAVRAADDELRLVVLNKGPEAVQAALHLGDHGTATIQRLIAPSPSATSGVTLAGQHLGAQGQWLGRRVLPQVSPVGGTYTVPMPAYSGALITVQL